MKGTIAFSVYDVPKGVGVVKTHEGTDQMPVFWACGVTPQAAARQARVPEMITHSPGHMFITDRRDAEYEV